MGSSKSSSSSSTASTDARSVADAGSIAVGGSGNIINASDSGLIKAGFDFFTTAEQANTDRLAVLLEAGGKVLDAGGKVLDASVQQAEKTNQSLQTILAAKQQQDAPGSLGTSQVALLILAAAGVLIMGRFKA